MAQIAIAKEAVVDESQQRSSIKPAADSHIAGVHAARGKHSSIKSHSHGQRVHAAAQRSQKKLGCCHLAESSPVAGIRAKKKQLRRVWSLLAVWLRLFLECVLVMRAPPFGSRLAPLLVGNSHTSLVRRRFVLTPPLLEIWGPHSLLWGILWTL